MHHEFLFPSSSIGVSFYIAAGSLGIITSGISLLLVACDGVMLEFLMHNSCQRIYHFDLTTCRGFRFFPM